MAGANCCSLRHDDHAERTWGGGEGTPDFVPRLEDREQGDVVGEAAAGEVPVDVAQSLPFADKRLRETGSGRDGAHGVADARGRQQHRSGRSPTSLAMVAESY